MIRRVNILTAVFLIFALYSHEADAQSGASIIGKVYDKTINKKVSADWVVLVKTGQGLETVKQFDRVSDYEFSNIPVLPNAPYLLRASYKGVVYTQNLMIQENKRYNVDLVVYEATDRWQNISVRIPHMVVLRNGDQLEIQQTFEINNSGQTAYVLSDVNKPTFRFKLPERTQFQNAQTSHNQSMPVTATAFAYEDGMGINQPLRPGLTQIQITYTADYSANTFELNSQWYYDIDECNVFISPKDIELVSDKLTHVHDERMEANNFSIYAASGIKANEVIAMKLSGGGTRQTEQNNESIAASDNMVQKKAFVWIFLMLSILSFALFFGLNRKAAAKPYQPATGQKKQNKQQRNELLKKRDALAQQIAQLDDTFDEKEMDSPTYQKRRDSLKSQLRKAAEDIHAL
ncbi:hypothetical protein F9K33_10750 [bacterium]|nr:MAG: hypothetical protein F9K33_10750 [bacterium]